MSVDIQPIPRPGGIRSRTLPASSAECSSERRTLGVAELRFSEHATIPEHPGENDAIVICLAGEGFTSVGGETLDVREEEWVLWPKGTTARTLDRGLDHDDADDRAGRLAGRRRAGRAVD